MSTAKAHPVLTEYEEKVFARFVARFDPGYHFHSIQLEGNKALPVVAAGYRLMKKGVVISHQSCHWYLTELGEEMAKLRKSKK